MRRMHLTLWVLAVLFVSASLPLTAGGAEMEDGAEDGAKSVIFLIGDGMGYAQLTAGRWEKAGGDQPDYQPTLDSYQEDAGGDGI